jgi:hypothetical protein
VGELNSKVESSACDSHRAIGTNFNLQWGVKVYMYNCLAGVNLQDWVISMYDVLRLEDNLL